MFNLKNLKNDPVAVEMIKLFACNKLEKIESDPSLIRKIFNAVPGVDTDGTIAETNQNILNTSGYTAFYCKLKELKAKMESTFNAGRETDQVKIFLSLLLGFKRLSFEQQDKKMIFKELINTAIQYGGLWAGNPLAIDKYNRGAFMIDEWVDFFLSYTNRDQPEVNNSFDDTLKNNFKKKDWDDSVEKLNMLAKLIVKYLRQRGNLNVFFDQQSMTCGDDIEDKVNRYCENTFSFAQLIQWQALSNDPGKKNWCYHEYDTFSKCNKDNEKGIFFFKTYDVPNDPEELGGIPPDWKDWVKHALTTVNVVIPKRMENDQLREECGMVAKKIISVRDKIISNYLASIN
jgi:hypothetical protein